jgi:TRAP-type C4-dicarboxylate transport system substrate-binding protein
LLLATQPVLAAATGVVVANSGSKTTPWFHQWQEFRRNIDEKSSGSILLDYLIFDELGSSNNMSQALLSGRASIGGLSCQGIVDVIPELAVPQLPFLFHNDAEAAFVFDRYLTPLFNQILAEHGLTLLGWADFGWSDVYAREPVHLPFELAGRQVRTSPNLVGPAYLRKIKAEPVTIPLVSLGAVQSDKVFAGFGSLVFFGDRVPPVYKYIVKTHHSFNCGIVAANKAWFDALSPADQNIIRTSLMPPAQARRETYAAAEQVYRTLAANGDTIIDLTPAQHNAWAAAGLPLYAGILQQAGGRSIEVYDAISAGKQAFLRETLH